MPLKELMSTTILDKEVITLYVDEGKVNPYLIELRTLGVPGHASINYKTLSFALNDSVNGYWARINTALRMMELVKC